MLLGADLRVQSRVRRRQPLLAHLRRRGVTAVGLRLGGRDQGHHLRVEQLPERAFGQRPKAGVEHHHHDAEEQRERRGNR